MQRLPAADLRSERSMAEHRERVFWVRQLFVGNGNLCGQHGASCGTASCAVDSQGNANFTPADPATALAHVDRGYLESAQVASPVPLPRLARRGRAAQPRTAPQETTAPAPVEPARRRRPLAFPAARPVNVPRTTVSTMSVAAPPAILPRLDAWVLQRHDGRAQWHLCRKERRCHSCLPGGEPDGLCGLPDQRGQLRWLRNVCSSAGLPAGANRACISGSCGAACSAGNQVCTSLGGSLSCQPSVWGFEDQSNAEGWVIGDGADRLDHPPSTILAAGPFPCTLQ